MSFKISWAKKTFYSLSRDLESPERPIDILIGMDHMHETPKEHAKGQGLVLYRSVFRTGYLVWGNMSPAEESKESLPPNIKPDANT